MKVHIQKLQSGGYTTFRPLFDTPSPTASSPFLQPKSQEKSSIVDDESDTLLKKGGLTSDYYELMDELNQLENSPTSFLDPNSTSKAIRLMRGRINEMVNNKDIWEKSIIAARTSGAINEIAIGNNDELFYRNDDNSISVTSIREYNKLKQKKTLLTVGELLNERQNNKSLAFNSSILNIPTEIGMKDIIKHVTDLFTTLSSYSDHSERTYDKKDLNQQFKLEQEIVKKSGKPLSDEERNAFKTLQELINTPGDYVKLIQEESGKGKNLNIALNYIWNTLSDNAKNKLEVQAIANGSNNPKEIIASMLMNYGAKSTISNISAEKESQVRDVDTSSDKNKSLTTFQLFHNDKLFSPNNKFAINDTKLSVLFRGAIAGISPAITPDGKIIQNATLGDILKVGRYASFLETNNIYFGNKKVDMENTDNIIYDESDMAKVYMPVRDGKPDFDAFKEFKDIYSVYESNKNNWTAKQAEEYFSDNGYKIQIDEKIENGKIIKVIKENAQIKPFLVLYGYTNDATGFTDDNPFATKLTNEEEQAILPKLKSIWTIGTGKSAKSIVPNKSWNKEDYYKGIITIPYRQGAFSIIDSMVNQGPLEQVSTYGQVQKNILNSSGSSIRGDTSGFGLNNK
jgi:hypothetical protein